MMKFAVLLVAFAVSAWALPVQQNIQSPGKVEDLKDKLELLQRELRQLRTDLQTEERAQGQGTQARVQAILDKFPEKDRAALRTFVEHKLKSIRAILGNSATEKREESGPGPEPQTGDDSNIALMPAGPDDRKIFISRELDNEPEEAGPGPEPKRAYLGGEQKVFVSRELDHELDIPVEESGPGPEPKRAYLGGEKKVFVSRELDQEIEEETGPGPEPKVYLGQDKKLFVSRELDHEYEEPQEIAQQRGAKLIVSRELEEDFDKEQVDADPNNYPDPVLLPASDKDRKIVIARELINEDDEEPEEPINRKLIISRDLEEEPQEVPQENNDEELRAIAQQMTAEDFQLLRNLRSNILFEMNDEEIAKREEVEVQPLPVDPYAELKALVDQMGPDTLEMLKDLIKKAKDIAADIDKPANPPEEAIQEDKRSDIGDISQDLGKYAEKLGQGALEYLQSHPDKLQEVKDIIEKVKKGEWNTPSDESDLSPVENEGQETTEAPPVQEEEKPEEVDRALNDFDDQQIDAADLQQEIPEGTFGEIIEEDVKRNLNIEPQPVENQQPGIWDEAPLPPQELGKDPETETEKIGERLLDDIDAARKEGVDVKELLGVLEERKQEMKTKEEEELEALSMAP